MIGFLLSVIGLLTVALIAFAVGLVLGVYAISKELNDKIEDADDEDKKILKKYLTIK